MKCEWHWKSGPCEGKVRKRPILRYNGRILGPEDGYYSSVCDRHWVNDLKASKRHAMAIIKSADVLLAAVKR